jgi:hypothetical protein
MQASDAPARLPWRLFWVGLFVRVAYITFAHTYKIRPILDHFDFGWEMGRIARSLATGYGYADPFAGHSGPTAWTPPLYPVLLGGVFKLFGVYTKTSAWVILTINSVFSAATAPVVYEIARHLFARGTGTRAKASSIALWSGWLWALYPAAMQYAVHWVWDMALTALLFSCVLLLALRVRDTDADKSSRQNRLRWLVFGVLWGLIALSNSSLLLFLPACTLWMLLPLLARRRFSLALRNASLAAVCCVLVVSPWVLRNYRVFHAFVPMRLNFGPEMFEATRPWNHGLPTMASLPEVESDPRYQHYRSVGELAYSRELGALAKTALKADPGRFAGRSLKRVFFFWAGVPQPAETWGARVGQFFRALNFDFASVGALLGLGLALNRRIPGAWLLFWAVLLLPLLYYVVTVQARFRHPLEPVMMVLIVYLFQSAERRSMVPKR